MTRFERLLRSQLQPAEPNNSESHLDADQISAFPENREAVMAHAAQCADCREALFLVAGERVLPVRRLWRWAWIPAAAVVCAVAIALPVFLRRSPPEPPLVVARSAPQIPPAPVLVLKDNPVSPKTVVRKRPEVKPVIQTGAASGAAILYAPAAPAPPPIASSQPVGSSMQSVEVASEAAVVQPQQQQQQQVDTAGQLAPQFAKQERSVGRVQAISGYYRAMRPMAMMGKVSARRWNVNQGVPEQSPDAGLSWHPVPIDQTVYFKAIGHFGNEVWAGGTGGALFHSSDSGEHWLRVIAVTSDITDVKVPSRLEVRLLTSTGEVWATHDGGHSWKPE